MPRKFRTTKRRRLGAELFEPRLMMDGSVIISEFMALNGLDARRRGWRVFRLDRAS